MSRKNNVKSKDLHLINDLNAALQKENTAVNFGSSSYSSFSWLSSSSGHTTALSKK